MIELLISIAQIVSAITAIIAFLSLILKPIRTKITKYFNSVFGTKEIYDILMKHISEDSQKQKNIKKQDEKIEEVIVAINEISKTIDRHYNLNNEVDLCLLRNAINKIYYKYIDMKYIPTYDRENLINMFEKYESRGGNSYIKTIVEELLALPSHL